MTVEATGPDGTRYEVRRTVVRMPGGSGWRLRWRGPRKQLEVIDLLNMGDMVDIPVVGGVIAAVIVTAVVVALAITLPFLLLGILEALLLGLLAAAGLAAATLFGRPIVVRVDAHPSPPAPGIGAPPTAEERVAPSEISAFAVVGWGASREVRDRLVEALRAGADLRIAAGHEAVPLHDRP